MADRTIGIDIVLNGIKSIADLSKELRGLRTAARDAERAGDSVSKVSRDTDRAGTAARKYASDLEKQAKAAEAAERKALSLASAQARLQQAQGNTSGAVRTLERALSGVNGQSLAAVRSQIQLQNLLSRYSNSPLISAVRNISGGFSSLTSAAGGAGNALSGVAGSASSAVGAVSRLHPAILAVVGALAGLGIGAGFLAKIGEAGVQVNKELEQLRLGLATTIASVSDIANAQGIKLTGIDALTAALGVADDQMKKLKVDALTTPLTFQQLSEGFLQAVGPGLSAGLTLDQIRKSTVSLSQVIIPLTGHAEQLGQELRGLLTGDITKNTQIARVLGITKADIDNAVRLGTLAEFLDEKLQVAAASGKLMAQTFQAAATNLDQAGQLIAASVTKGLFDELRDKINSVLPQIFDQTTGSISSSFKGITDTLTQIFNTSGAEIAKLIDFVVGGLKSVSEFLKEHQSEVTQIIIFSQKILENLGGIVTDLFGALGNTKTWGEGVKATAAAFRLVSIIVGQIREGLNVLFNVVVALGSALQLALLEPIAAAVKLMAKAVSFIPVVGDAAQAIANTIDSFVKTTTARFENSVSRIGAGVRNIGSAFRSASTISLTDEFGAVRPLSDVARAGLGSESGVSIKGRPRPVKEKKGPKPVSDAGAQKQLREAELALEKAFADREVALAKATQSEETRILQQQLEDRQISLSQFYDEMARLQAAAVKQEIEGFQAAIRAERAKLAAIDLSERERLAKATKQGEAEKIRAEAEAERLRTNAAIVGLETKINEAEAKGEAEAAANARARIKAARDLKNELDQISVEFLRVTGQDLGAANAEIDNRFADILKRTKAEFGEFSEQVKAILNLIRALKQEAGVRDAAREVSNIGAQLDFAKVGVQNDLAKGVITERQARKELLELQRAYVAQVLPKLDAQIQKQKELTGAESEEVIVLETRKLALEQLTIDTESAFRRIKRSAEEGLLNVLERLGTEIKSVGQFFSELANTIIAEVKRIAAENIVDAIFGKRQQGGQGGGGQQQRGGLIDSIIGIFTGGRKQQQQTGFGVPVADVAAGVEGEDVPGGAGGESPFQGLVEKFKNFFSGFFDKLKGIFGGVVDKFGSIFGSLLSSLGSVFSSIAGGIGKGLSSVVGFIGKGIGALFGGGFADGGFTGFGDRTRPAGVVHRGEFVFNKRAVQALGVPQLGLLHGLAQRAGSGGGGFLGAFAGGGVLGLAKAFGVKERSGFGGGVFGRLLSILLAKDAQLPAIDPLARIRKLFGFEDGGFTGFGSTMAPAGIVHGREFVFSAPAVENLGVGVLSQLHAAAKRGYQSGGLVGALTGSSGAGVAGASQGITVIAAIGDEELEDALDKAQGRGDRTFITRAARNKRELKLILGT